MRTLAILIICIVLIGPLFVTLFMWVVLFTPTPEITETPNLIYMYDELEVEEEHARDTVDR